MIHFPADRSGASPLRVLQIGKFYPPHMGGIETHLQVLCEQLRERVDLRVLVANGTRRTHREVIGEVDVTRVGTLLKLSAAPICPAMAREIRNARPDLVHLHLPNPAAVLAYLASGHRGPVVVSYHSDIVRQRVLGPAFEPILHRLLRRCDRIIAATPNHIDSSPVLRAHRERCAVIPYGIPIEQFGRRDPEAVAAVRARYGPRMVLSVGRLVYYKGFEFLLRAMRDVDGQLVIVGEGPLDASLRALAVSLGIEKRVHFVGKVPDAAPYYQAAEVFALASIARSEAFGIVQLEAMAAGTPVINTRLDSGVPYVSLDGVTGVTVPPRDAGALAAAINLLQDDPGLRGRYARAARERAEKEFSQEIMTERMLELYRSVVGERAAAPRLAGGAAARRGSPAA